MKRLALGILSWKAHETLTKTLTSYAAGGLPQLVDECIIHFNQQSDADNALAAKFGYTAHGSPENLGLLGGTAALAEGMDAEYLLLLQNDCPLCVDREAAAKYLKEGVELLESGKADIVRCRHRWNVGEGFSDVKNYLKYWGPGSWWRRLFRPFKARRMIGRSPYAEQHPELKFPKYIHAEGDFLIVDSSVINFTDQPFLIKKSLFLELLKYAKAHPSHRTLNGFQVVEICLNCAWWRQQHFKIAVGEGMFTHNRFDDSFRSNHHAFNSGVNAAKQ